MGSTGQDAMSDLDDLLGRLRRLHPMLIDLSLGRLEALLVRLGSPERRLPPVIHVAGTNGKGSTTAFVKAMLEASGRRVHVYTSPHLVRFNERIAVPSAGGIALPIDEDLLASYLARVEAVNAGAPITFFEVTTAAAFLAFAEIEADYALLEVGLGGEFDATNVIERPALSVITPVAMDHADKLGGTLAQIAQAKAGILKRGSPAVISRQEDVALDVISRRAVSVGSGPVDFWGQDFEAFEQRARLVYQSDAELLDLPLPALVGPHQIVNAGTAIAAIRRLGLGSMERAIERGLQTVRWPARMQRLPESPLTDRLPPDSELWLDGGHNPHGGIAIAQTLADLEERAPKPLIVVLGMMGQKDQEGFLAPFRGLARRILTVPIPGAHERPADPKELVGLADYMGFDAEAAEGIEAALEKIGRRERSPVRVLICGSLYLAGHVLALRTGAAKQSN